jgi:hypothetical protein
MKIGGIKNKLNKRDMVPNAVVYQLSNGLFCKKCVGIKYVLIKPQATKPRLFTSFIPECKGDTDEWDDKLNIVGADCEVWVTEKWWVKDIENNTSIKDICAFLCKWSTAINNEMTVIKTKDLEIDGYFDVLI